MPSSVLSVTWNAPAVTGAPAAYAKVGSSPVNRTQPSNNALRRFRIEWRFMVYAPLQRTCSDAHADMHGFFSGTTVPDRYGMRRSVMTNAVNERRHHRLKDA